MPANPELFSEDSEEHLLPSPYRAYRQRKDGTKPCPPYYDPELVARGRAVERKAGIWKDWNPNRIERYRVRCVICNRRHRLRLRFTPHNAVCATCEFD